MKGEQQWLVTESCGVAIVGDDVLIKSQTVVAFFFQAKGPI